MNAIAILFGIVAIAAGVLEIGITFLAEGWWKLLYGLLAVVFIAAGVVSFVHPGTRPLRSVGRVPSPRRITTTTSL